VEPKPSLPDSLDTGCHARPLVALLGKVAGVSQHRHFHRLTLSPRHSQPLHRPPVALPCSNSPFFGLRAA
jgi:hypothetical protein